MVFSGQSLTSDAFAAGIIPRQVVRRGARWCLEEGLSACPLGSLGSCRGVAPTGVPAPLPQFGICYQRPQKDANCASPLVPNSAIVLGSAVPTAAGPPARLSVVPLVHLDPGPGSYLSPATLVTLPPVPGTRTPQRIRFPLNPLPTYVRRV